MTLTCPHTKLSTIYREQCLFTRIGKQKMRDQVVCQIRRTHSVIYLGIYWETCLILGIEIDVKTGTYLLQIRNTIFTFSREEFCHTQHILQTLSHCQTSFFISSFGSLEIQYSITLYVYFKYFFFKQHINVSNYKYALKL